LTGVREQARSALKDAGAVIDLYEKYLGKLKGSTRPPRTAAAILDALFENPILSIPRFAKRSGYSFPTVVNGVEFWIDRGLLKEITGRQRNRLFIAQELLTVMAASETRKPVQPPDKLREQRTQTPPSS
jgi:hypothetical protein